MKTALLIALLLAVAGVAGFLYRSTLEAPLHNTNATGSSTAATCEQDTKVCPDGTSVVRTAPSCAFAACTLPNVELASVNVAFALPATYKANTAALGNDSSLIGAYEKAAIASSGSQPDTIVVRRYAIPEGKDANSVMLAETMYESSGNQPTSMEEFTPVIINGRTYQMIVVERFEALVHVEYYLPREHDVLRFEALEHNVTNWTDPTLTVRTLSSVAALEGMLATLQSGA